MCFSIDYHMQTGNLLGEETQRTKDSEKLTTSHKNQNIISYS